MEKHIVNSASLFEVDDNFVDDRFMKVRITAIHSGINRNGSRFTLDVINEAKDTFKNIPILAEVKEYTDENGEKHLDYTTHAMHIEQDAFNEDSNRIIYDEKIVGIVPETNNFEIVHDDETGNDYCLVDALIYREYGNYAADILNERGGKTDVSAEIACEDISYSVKDKCLDVGKMTMCAITLLGADVQPGMAKAHAEIFSANENKREEEILNFMQELKEVLDKYIGNTKENSKEGGETQVDSEMILEEVTETTEFEEQVEEVAEETTLEEVTVEEELSEDPVETPADEVVEEEIPEEVIEQNSLKYSVSRNGETKEFSISLSEKLYAMNQLINETYGELDNDYYDVEVFEDDNIVEMYSWWTGKAYRQSFKCKKKCSYQLIGDRVEIFKKYLSQDEITALENMKTNYSSISEKLQKYEEEPQKNEILESAKYQYISDTKEFKTLKDDHFDLSIEEVTAKANDILLSYAEQGALRFASNSDVIADDAKEVGLKTLPIITKKTSRYGNLFS